MRTTFDILSGLYRVIRPVVIDEITGGVYLNNEPHQDQKENVIMRILANPVSYVQVAVVNVNVSAMGINEHTADLQRMKEVVDMIVPLVDDKYHFVDGVTLHCDVEDDKGVFADQEIKGKFFYNIRLRCITL